MKMRCGMKDNLRFDTIDGVARAQEALASAYQVAFGKFYVTCYTCAFEEDTNDILVFLPIYAFERVSSNVVQNFFDSLLKQFQELGFEILEDRVVSGWEYFHIGSTSRLFRLKVL